MRPLMQVRRLNDGWTMCTSGKTDRPSVRPSVRSIAQQATVMIDASLLPLLRKAKSANSFRSSLVASVPTAFYIRRKSGSVRSAINIPNWRIATRLFLSLTLDGDARRRSTSLDVARLIVIYYHRERKLTDFSKPEISPVKSTER